MGWVYCWCTAGSCFVTVVSACSIETSTIRSHPLLFSHSWIIIIIRKTLACKVQRGAFHEKGQRNQQRLDYARGDDSTPILLDAQYVQKCKFLLMAVLVSSRVQIVECASTRSSDITYSCSRKGYTARWHHGRKGHNCPNLKPQGNWNEVTTKYPDGRVEYCDSLAHLWNDWYKMYLEDDILLTIQDPLPK